MVTMLHLYALWKGESMKRLYWLFQSLFNPVYRDEYNRLGEGEYLANHGVGNSEKVKDINTIDGYRMGKVLSKLDKQLKHE